MDSLSQIVLGASVGEVVLGKKLGNRAMLWGALGGTIPDLDILFDPVMTELQSLAFHRGFTHSILFSFLGGGVFGYLLYQFYQRKYKRQKVPVSDRVTLSDGVQLFFWAFLTHIALDCFTMYGTQVFSPFSDYRLAFSTIAVADIFYTIPFIVCLIVSSFCKRGSQKRRNWNLAGLAISTAYLLFTVYHKTVIREVFETQLSNQKIEYNNAILGPTIMTNFLWNMTIDTGDKYYHGQYSIFDKSPITFRPIDKNHHLIPESDDDMTISTLKWFTDHFYNIVEKDNGKLQFNDLRYGTFSGHGEGENDYIFRFEIEKLSDGSYNMSKADGGPPPGQEQNMMSALYQRIKGI